SYFIVKYHTGKESKIAPEDVVMVTDAAWSFPDCYIINYRTPKGRSWRFCLTNEVSQELFRRYPEILSKIWP
ncbi:MAG: hypothetical protein V3U09_06505, partial [Thermoplasmata archaeon]